MGNQNISVDEDDAYVFTKEELRVLYENFVSLDKDKSGQIEPEEFLDVPELSENPIVKKIISIYADNIKKGFLYGRLF